MALENKPRVGSRALDKSGQLWGSPAQPRLCAAGSGETNCDVQPKISQRVVFKPCVLSLSLSNGLFPEAILPRIRTGENTKSRALWNTARESPSGLPLALPLHPGGCRTRLTDDAQEAGRLCHQPAAPLQSPHKFLPVLRGELLFLSAPLLKKTGRTMKGGGSKLGLNTY